VNENELSRDDVVNVTVVNAPKSPDTLT